MTKALLAQINEMRTVEASAFRAGYETGFKDGKEMAFAEDIDMPEDPEDEEIIGIGEGADESIEIDEEELEV